MILDVVTNIKLLQWNESAFLSCPQKLSNSQNEWEKVEQNETLKIFRATYSITVKVIIKKRTSHVLALLLF